MSITSNFSDPTDPINWSAVADALQGTVATSSETASNCLLAGLDLKVQGIEMDKVEEEMVEWGLFICSECGWWCGDCADTDEDDICESCYRSKYGDEEE